jgi:hypothetical protein
MGAGDSGNLPSSLLRGCEPCGKPSSVEPTPQARQYSQSPNKRNLQPIAADPAPAPLSDSLSSATNASRWKHLEEREVCHEAFKKKLNPDLPQFLPAKKVFSSGANRNSFNASTKRWVAMGPQQGVVRHPPTRTQLKRKCTRRLKRNATI